MVDIPKMPDLSKMQSGLSSALASSIAAMPRINDDSPAKDAMDLVVDELRAFQDGLADNEEMAIIFGGAYQVNLKQVGRRGKHFIVFSGTTGNRRVRIIQHLAQLNILLTAQEIESGRQAYRLGFDTSQFQSK